MRSWTSSEPNSNLNIGKYLLTTAWDEDAKEAYRHACSMNMFHRYGIYPDWYMRIYLQQKGECALCDKRQSKGNWLFVDHSHDDHRRVRGLLCRGCNVQVGKYEEGRQVSSLIEIENYLIQNCAGSPLIYGPPNGPLYNRSVWLQLREAKLKEYGFDLMHVND